MQPVLLQKKTVIGRGSEADLILVEKGISRKHLLIEVEKDKIFLTDLGSANGTTIGDEKLDPNKRLEFSTFFMPIGLGQNVEILIEPHKF